MTRISDFENIVVAKEEIAMKMVDSIYDIKNDFLDSCHKLNNKGHPEADDCFKRFDEMEKVDADNQSMGAE